jgi:hypothetical protein
MKFVNENSLISISFNAINKKVLHIPEVVEPRWPIFYPQDFPQPINIYIRKTSAANDRYHHLVEQGSANHVV